MLNVQGGKLLVKNGALQTDCGCCGGWYCYGYNPGCVDTTGIITRATRWACGEGNEPPESIAIRVTYSGEEVTVWRGFNCDEKGCSQARQITASASTANNFDAVLSRHIDSFPTRYGSGHCYYKGPFAATQGLEIHPGAACGGGWDAGLVAEYSLFPVETPASDPIPIAEFSNPFPGVYVPPTACQPLIDQKGAFPTSFNFFQKLPGIWSNLPCSTEPNASLTGFSWTVCRHVTSIFGNGNFQGTYSVPITVATVEVI